MGGAELCFSETANRLYAIELAESPTVSSTWCARWGFFLLLFFSCVFSRSRLWQTLARWPFFPQWWQSLSLKWHCAYHHSCSIRGVEPHPLGERVPMDLWAYEPEEAADVLRAPVGFTLLSQLPGKVRGLRKGGSSSARSLRLRWSTMPHTSQSRSMLLRVFPKLYTMLGKLPQFRHVRQDVLAVASCTRMKVEPFDDNGWSGLDVLLHSVHNFCKGDLRRLSRGEVVPDKLVGLSAYAVCLQSWRRLRRSITFHIGLPGLLSIMKFADCSMSGHDCRSIIVANVISWQLILVVRTLIYRIRECLYIKLARMITL